MSDINSKHSDIFQLDDSVTLLFCNTSVAAISTPKEAWNSSSEMFQGAAAEHKPRLRHHILPADPLRVNLNRSERQQKVLLNFSSFHLGFIFVFHFSFSSFSSHPSFPPFFFSSLSSKPSPARECDG